MSPSANIFVTEYFFRMSLRKIGLQSNLDDIDCITGEAFSIIANELNKIENEEIAKAKRKSARSK